MRFLSRVRRSFSSAPSPGSEEMCPSNSILAAVHEQSRRERVRGVESPPADVGRSSSIAPLPPSGYSPQHRFAPWGRNGKRTRVLFLPPANGVSVGGRALPVDGTGRRNCRS
jgi:hypothetical protein